MITTDRLIHFKFFTYEAPTFFDTIRFQVINATKDQFIFRRMLLSFNIIVLILRFIKDVTAVTRVLIKGSRSLFLHTHLYLSLVIISSTHRRWFWSFIVGKRSWFSEACGCNGCRIGCCFRIGIVEVLFDCTNFIIYLISWHIAKVSPGPLFLLIDWVWERLCHMLPFEIIY